MGFIIPASEISIADVKSLKKKIKAKLVELAVKETGKDASEFVVRDAFPEDDFDFANVNWQNQTAQVANTWTEDWTKELPKDKFVAFYGVKVIRSMADPDLYGVKYAVGSQGATVKEQVHLQKCMEEILVTSGVCKAYKGYHDPVYYKGTETINIALISDAAVGAETADIELLCLVCEPYGAVISGKQEV